LDDLDFADDKALLSHSPQQMQDKSSKLLTVSAQVGVNIHRIKTKVSMLISNVQAWGGDN
ncbi:hypothetical protein XENOCAPTIV_003304, partial [Xenoophorus captivus]